LSCNPASVYVDPAASWLGTEVTSGAQAAFGEPGSVKISSFAGPL
jgi:hypothetical protein